MGPWCNRIALSKDSVTINLAICHLLSLLFLSIFGVLQAALLPDWLFCFSKGRYAWHASILTGGRGLEKSSDGGTALADHSPACLPVFVWQIKKGGEAEFCRQADEERSIFNHVIWMWWRERTWSERELDRAKWRAVWFAYVWTVKRETVKADVWLIGPWTMRQCALKLRPNSLLLSSLELEWNQITEMTPNTAHEIKDMWAEVRLLGVKACKMHSSFLNHCSGSNRVDMQPVSWHWQEHETNWPF